MLRPPPLVGEMKERQLIFVQIAAFRDPQLIPTLHDMLLQADYSDRLRIGIARQYCEDQSVAEKEGNDRPSSSRLKWLLEDEWALPSPAAAQEFADPRWWTEDEYDRKYPDPWEEWIFFRKFLKSFQEIQS
jgi:Glycosyltransferase (GlcNAc)